MAAACAPRTLFEVGHRPTTSSLAGLVAVLSMALGVVGLPTGLHAQTCADYQSFLHVVGAFDPGNVSRIASDGQVVCGVGSVAGTSNNFFVLDLTNPASPALASSAQVTLASSDLEVVDGVAYIVSGSTSLQIIDVHNPFAPVVRGTVPLAASDVALAGSTAYVATGSAGITVVDMANLDAPSIVGTIPVAATHVALNQSMLYAASHGALTVIDLTNPSTPLVRGSTSFGNPREIVTDGSLVVCADDNWDGISIYDCSKPDAPVFVRGMTLPDFTGSNGPKMRDVVVCDHVAYLAHYHDGLQVVDIHTPTAPVLLGTIGSLIATQSVAFAQGLLCMDENAAGLSVVDPTPPQSVPVLSELNIPAISVATNGTTISALGDPGLYTVQFSGGALVQVGLLPLPDGAQIVAAGNDVFVYPPYNTMMNVIDISSPSSPTPVGSLEGAPVFAPSPSIQGNLLVDAAATGGGIRLIDISNPSQLHVRSTIPSMSFPVIHGSYVYASGSGNNISVIDISNPDSPSIVGSVPTPVQLDPLAARENRLWCTAGGNVNAGLYELDISNPTAPVLMGKKLVSSNWTQLTFDGNLGYGSRGPFRGVLEVLDMTDKDAPVRIGSRGFQDPGDLNLVIHGNVLVVADHDRLVALAKPCLTTDVGERARTTALSIAPNPTPGPVTFRFGLPRAGNAEVNVFDVAGRRVARVFAGGAAGMRTVAWNGRSTTGEPLTNGVYFVELKTPAGVVRHRMAVVR